MYLQLLINFKSSTPAILRKNSSSSAHTIFEEALLVFVDALFELAVSCVVVDLF
jgi:hypothetical protein